MFEIKYNNVFLDLVPNQDCEIERNSPLFLIDNFFAEYSTPISIAYSDSNAKALGWYFFEPTIRKRQNLDVEVYDKGTYKCNATLALESAGINNRNKGASNAGGYLLIGISDFLQTIQKKKLAELQLGGDRIFSFTTWNAYDNSNGFFQHFHSTWDGTFDYVFATCRNDMWTGSIDDPFSTGYMNTLDTAGSMTMLMPYQPVVPFVRIKFILESIFKESGWTVDFSGINDTEWEQLFLWSVKPLYTCQTTYSYNTSTNKIDPINTAVNQLKIHLGDYMPDYTCAELIVALCMRYGWAVITSTTKRSSRLVALKEMKNKPAKDWTRYAAAASGSQISVDEKIFAFKQDFEGNDGFPNQPDLTGWTILPAVNTFHDLPNPISGLYDTSLIYVYADNQYYQVTNSTDASTRIWSVLADNIYDEDAPDGEDATDTFETKCTTLPVYKTIFRQTGGITWYAYFPVCSQSRTDKFGIKTLLYQGLVTEAKDDGTPGSLQYPSASSVHIKHDGSTPLSWSNVYRHVDTAGNDHGLIAYWFQKWLDIISNVEDSFKKNYFLPLFELIQFKWDDVILDSGIPYLIKQMIEPLPYKGFVECTMQRVLLQKSLSATSPVNTQKVYLKITYENYAYGESFEDTDTHGTSDWTNATSADIIVRSYADPAGTIPLTLSAFSFKVSTSTFKNGVLFFVPIVNSWIMNGNEINVNYYAHKIVEGDFAYHAFGYPGIMDGHYVITDALVVDAAYEIIS